MNWGAAGSPHPDSWIPPSPTEAHAFGLCGLALLNNLARVSCALDEALPDATMYTTLRKSKTSCVACFGAALKGQSSAGRLYILACVMEGFRDQSITYAGFAPLGPGSACEDYEEGSDGRSVAVPSSSLLPATAALILAGVVTSDSDKRPARLFPRLIRPLLAQKSCLSTASGITTRADVVPPREDDRDDMLHAIESCRFRARIHHATLQAAHSLHPFITGATFRASDTYRCSARASRHRPCASCSVALHDSLDPPQSHRTRAAHHALLLEMLLPVLTKCRACSNSAAIKRGFTVWGLLRSDLPVQSIV
ncbi:hypothetical protein B0H15DRAFT_944022 [Mycena belliarum]|uniref:Uncharacterized protein n=1 Tax=Mycena belliarum TaxID=1033014 RepID=A0AAD6Y0B5_9AGAR|nr:hypothetical protein B0H15DRAFT_944022 [Mycena belliae]